MEKLSISIQEELNTYKVQEQIVFQLQHNFIFNNNDFIVKVSKYLQEEVIVTELLNSGSITKDLIKELYLKLSAQKQETELLILTKASLIILKSLEYDFLQLSYVNALNNLLVFYEEILIKEEFSKDFYKQLITYLQQYFSPKISILLLNINNYLVVKLQQYNKVLLNYPPTKEIKQLRLIEYVQNFLLCIEQLKGQSISLKDIIIKYGYMLKVLKNNRKELINIEILTNDNLPNYQIDFVETANFLGFKKALNPNYEEKKIIKNKEQYNEAIRLTKQILNEYNQMNGIKVKKRKRKKNV
ncbi:MAG: hypothetical protein ACK5HR_02445 [Mycoplasmatales bacterium]